MPSRHPAPAASTSGRSVACSPPSVSWPSSTGLTAGTCSSSPDLVQPRHNSLLARRRHQLGWPAQRAIGGGKVLHRNTHRVLRRQWAFPATVDPAPLVTYWLVTAAVAAPLIFPAQRRFNRSTS